MLSAASRRITWALYKHPVLQLGRFTLLRDGRPSARHHGAWCSQEKKTRSVARISFMARTLASAYALWIGICKLLLTDAQLGVQFLSIECSDLESCTAKLHCLEERGWRIDLKPLVRPRFEVGRVAPCSRNPYRSHHLIYGISFD